MPTRTLLRVEITPALAESIREQAESKPPLMLSRNHVGRLLLVEALVARRKNHARKLKRKLK